MSGSRSWSWAAGMSKPSMPLLFLVVAAMLTCMNASAADTVTWSCTADGNSEPFHIVWGGVGSPATLLGNAGSAKLTYLSNSQDVVFFVEVTPSGNSVLYAIGPRGRFVQFKARSSPDFSDGDPKLVTFVSEGICERRTAE